MALTTINDIILNYISYIHKYFIIFPFIKVKYIYKHLYKYVCFIILKIVHKCINILQLQMSWIDFQYFWRRIFNKNAIRIWARTITNALFIHAYMHVLKIFFFPIMLCRTIIFTHTARVPCKRVSNSNWKLIKYSTQNY